MPRPVILVVDGAARPFTKGRVSVGVIEGEFVEAEILELVHSEAQFPRDVSWADGEGIVVFDDEGHGEVVK